MMANIENAGFRNDRCTEVKIDIVEDLTDNMEQCSTNNQPLTIYIADLLEKLTKEISIEKYYDSEAGQYRLNIEPPKWFNSIDTKYQNILYKLLEPYLDVYIAK